MSGLSSCLRIVSLQLTDRLGEAHSSKVSVQAVISLSLVQKKKDMKAEVNVIDVLLIDYKQRLAAAQKSQKPVWIVSKILMYGTTERTDLRTAWLHILKTALLSTASVAEASVIGHLRSSKWEHIRAKTITLYYFPIKHWNF